MTKVRDEGEGVENDSRETSPSAVLLPALPPPLYRSLRPQGGPSDGWAPAMELRRRDARAAYEALDATINDYLARTLPREAGAAAPSWWTAAQHLAAYVLDVRAETVRHAQEELAPRAASPAQWPGRWWRTRALRVAWAMGEHARLASIGVPPNPTAALLGEVEALAGRPYACALRHPEAIARDGGPLTAPQAVRVVHLCATIAEGAYRAARSAAASGSPRDDDRGALVDAVADLLHVAAPLAAAGDAMAAQVRDLAAALYIRLPLALRRAEAQAAAALSPEALGETVLRGEGDIAIEAGGEAADEAAKDRAQVAALATAVARARQAMHRPFLDMPDPLAKVTVPPSDECEWLDSWRDLLSLCRSSWSSAERAGAAFVTIAEVRGWGAKPRRESFRDAFIACVTAPDEESERDPITRAIERALVALGHGRRTYLAAEDRRRERAAGLAAFVALRDSHPKDWEAEVRKAIEAEGGVNSHAAVALHSCGVDTLRKWVDETPTLKKWARERFVTAPRPTSAPRKKPRKPKPKRAPAKRSAQ